MRHISGAVTQISFTKGFQGMPNLKLTLVAIILPLFILPLSGSAVSRRNAPSNPHPTARLSGPGAVGTQSDEKTKTPTVAILLFDRVEIIDFAGPWEVFGGAGYKVFTVAEKLDPVNTVYGQKIVADYTFDNSPKADVLLVPGGGVGGAVANAKLIKWVQDNAKTSTYVMSVCTGAFILAKADLLNGLTATTVRGGIDRLAIAFPNIKVVYDKRYVDNGKVITTAGLSSGIDGSFYLVSRMLGKGRAQQTALGLEYKWDPEAKFARAAYADRYLPNFQGLDGDIVSIDGDTDHWEVKALITKPASASDIMETIRKQVVADTPHKTSAVVVTAKGPENSDRGEIEWRFTDDRGRAWVGSGLAETSKEKTGAFNVNVRLARAR
jgi:putative intracellular protease/amidase